MKLNETVNISHRYVTGDMNEKIQAILRDDT